MNDNNNNSKEASTLQDEDNLYMLDIYLMKGTQLIFIDFIEKFLSELNASCGERKSSNTTLLENSFRTGTDISE